MKSRFSQLLLLICTIICLFLLVGIQISWVLRSARMQESQFNHTVTLAMNRIVDNLSRNQAICSEMNNCLRKNKSQSCFLMMNNRMEWADLDSLIKSDLEYYNIDLDYEFDIVEGSEDVALTPAKEIYINTNLEKVLEQSGYELRIRFPDRNEFIKAQIGYIFISSIALLVLVCISFILIYKFFRREKKLSAGILEFINNMTHEFKTPLTNIALANSMISKQEKVINDDKLTSFSNIIRNEHQRLKNKVDILLKAAVSESDQPTETENFDAAEEIRNVADTFAVRIEEKQGTLIINSTGGNLSLTGNIEMFQIAIGNLIDNAIRYTKRAPVIEVSIYTCNESVHIKVSDNGVGIGRDDLSRIFDKYYRISTGDIHDNDGFGLGLYYVKTAIEKMNGRISVSSHIDKGTTFLIELPVAKNNVRPE